MMHLQVTLPTAKDDADEAEPMETDDAEEETSQPAAFDFSRLKRQAKATMGPKDREQLDEQYRTDIEARATALARAAPNLKAVEQYDAV